MFTDCACPTTHRVGSLQTAVTTIEIASTQETTEDATIEIENGTAEIPGRTDSTQESMTATISGVIPTGTGTETTPATGTAPEDRGRTAVVILPVAPPRGRTKSDLRGPLMTNIPTLNKVRQYTYLPRFPAF